MSLHLGFKHMSKWRKIGHIPVLILLQILFIILFAMFVVYDPNSAVHHSKSTENGKAQVATFPMFQDVHVMIFIGFGFLMTFLKKYGLSAVSLNMLNAVICLQWATLIYGFVHLHDCKTYSDTEKDAEGNFICTEKWPGPGKIYLNITESMLYSDFAAAAVLISFGVVIGTTSPLQLITMSLIEIVIFAVNEVIGRKIFKAIDAGDTIFVHTFGAYFGLACSRVLYDKNVEKSKNEGSGYTSDLFSMIGTIFLWMFWPSFNSATAIPGDAQQRAILNTYFSLCACVLSAFAMSALLNDHKKFVMEHIQNATLAGGVAIGAVADLMVGPWAALTIGGLAGILSVVGFEFVSPWLSKRLHIHDTCGVHNLHGMPGVFGSLISCIVVAFASIAEYGDSLSAIMPRFEKLDKDKEGYGEADIASKQAVYQLLALVVTILIAVVGGSITGMIMRMIAKFERLDEHHRPNQTILKLALSVGNLTGQALGVRGNIMPEEAYFDDHLFFEVHEDEKIKKVIIKDHKGKKRNYDHRRDSVSFHEMHRDSLSMDMMGENRSNRSRSPSVASSG
eukprot:08154.XXX_80611_78065_1 [CDS] Oithona nana genome sequencing.